MEYQTILTDLNKNILIITLNRPERMNAFNKDLLNDLLQALDEADKNDEVKAIIFTGAGKAFCAGADLGKGGVTFDYSSENIEDFRDEGGILALRLFNMKKPIIAAINGAAVGVGATMTLPMDIRVAAEHSKFGFVFASRGIVPESASSWFLPKIVGLVKSIEWIFTGKIFNAQEAKSAGLVNEVVPKGEVLTRAIEIASEIIENTSALSITFSRHLLWKMLGEKDPLTAHLEESKLLFWAGSRADAKEGVQSFLEKRKANYSLKVSENLPPKF